MPDSSNADFMDSIVDTVNDSVITYSLDNGIDFRFLLA